MVTKHSDNLNPQVKVGGVTRYHTVGYSTVYEYYAYGREVNRKRPRIAQMVNIKIDSNRIIVSKLYCV